MKLLDLTNFYGKQSGGVRTYLDQKIEYIEKRADIEHTLIIPGERDEVVYRKRTKILKLSGWKVPFYPSYRLVLNIPKIKETIKKEAPDIVELSDPYTMALALFMARIDKPIIGVYHADLPAYFRRYLSGFGLSRIGESIGWKYVKWIFGQCSLVLAPSNQVIEMLKAHKVNKNIKEIFYGVDNKTFSPEKKDEGFRERYKIKEDSVILLYVGRLAKEKHLHILTSAFMRLGRKYHLCVVGDGPYRKEMEIVLKSKGVTFFGYTRDLETLARIYASADIFVTPSPTETFGITVLEALASGLPVVGVDRGGVKDVITQDVGVLAQPDNPEDLAEKIAFLVSIKGVMGKKMIEKARAYTWEAAFSSIFEHYEECM